jgi:Amt family ammonium transporter
VSVPSSLIIGPIAGVLVVISVRVFDRVEVDDPVGAAPGRSGRRAGTLT